MMTRIAVRTRLLLIVIALLALAAPAAANPYLPAAGHVFAGVGGGYDTADFERATGSHPAIFQFFGGWDQSLTYMFNGARAAHSRLMIHVSTARGSGDISPGDIAAGRGDAYLLSLNGRIAGNGGVTYIRLMAEMDGHWNPYCAYTASGRSKGPRYSTAMFRQAWRRAVIVIRGGPLATVNAKLRALRMPPVDNHGHDLPQPQVSFLWVPQVEGAPAISANSPQAYWPGAQYVDWVGTDFYSKFPNWGGLESFYRSFGGKPFAFGEWALWGSDDPSFVHRLFAWSRSHGRVRMMMYNQGKRTDGPFRLVHYPRSSSALTGELRAPRFTQYAPEFQH
jgi:hypothetical protein